MGSPWHDILMITYNRPAFTRMALDRLLETCDEHMRVWLWHNGTDPKTLGIVRESADHPAVHAVEICEDNRKLREPTNWFWANADGAFFSKVDDDCLLPDGWGRTLRQAHARSPSLGLVACWRFYDDDFVPELAERKMQDLPGGCRLMKHHHVQGSGYVMKRQVVEAMGLLRNDESFTHYCWRIETSGWDIGWYYPFIHEEHMDDARSRFYPHSSDEEFLAQRPLTAVNNGVMSLDDWRARSRWQARILQSDCSRARDHVGWRGRLLRLRKRLISE